MIGFATEEGWAFGSKSRRLNSRFGMIVFVTVGVAACVASLVGFEFQSRNDRLSDAAADCPKMPWPQV